MNNKFIEILDWYDLSPNNQMTYIKKAQWLLNNNYIIDEIGEEELAKQLYIKSLP